MPSFCVVFNCSDRYGHAENISFHKFPFKRKDLLDKWTDFAQRGPDWKPTKWSAICSQHFTSEDFNCLSARKTLKKTAVPTIRLDDNPMIERSIISQMTHSTHDENSTKKTSIPIKSINNVTGYQDEDGEMSDGSEEVLQTKTTTASSGSKTNCRLCGLCSNAAVTFSTNFEIFGMIQKCFPTLNIQQVDNLPKDMCCHCLKRLEHFSEFIDQVLEAQRELQKKFLIEKSNTKAVETRPLKIKQEPVVKVEQEVAEGFDSFLSDDLDIGIDECCEQEQETTDEVEQKFGFYEFPTLNTQDIINNCDIMEIINLDDPFIDIADDDIPGASQQTNKYVHQAHQLLQSHMLIDEHNYACPAEDLKEEWQIKKYYKQEKTEMYEQHKTDESTMPEVEDEFQNIFPHEENVDAENFELFENQRSTKPIVTSVSAIAESRLQFANEIQAEVAIIKGNNSVNTVNTDAKNDMCSGKRHKDPSNKPNIVVLNESIVKSTAAFQLHACAVCQLKFFSIESLQQHVNFTHMNTPNVNNLPPMVSLPSANITHGNIEIVHENVNDLMKQTTKASSTVDANEFYDKNSESNDNFSNGSNKQQPQQQDSDNNYLNQQLMNFQSWQQNIKTFQINAMINNALSQASSCAATESLEQDNIKNKNVCEPETENQGILQTVELKCLEPAQLANACKDILIPQTLTGVEEVESCTIKGDDIFKTPLPHKRKTKRLARNTRLQFKAKDPKTLYKKKKKLRVADDNFQLLKQRYMLLLQKCKVLQENCQVLKAKSSHNSKTPKIKNRFLCKACSLNFGTIFQMLQHKQKFHPAPRLYTKFSATCYGCEKYFFSKIAFTNHMTYICQSLSLRCMKRQLKIFKCRFCHIISFTHWRLCRNHEIVCKRKRVLASRLKYQNLLLQRRKNLYLICTICRGKFPNVNALLHHYNMGVCKLSTVAVDCAVKCRRCQEHFQLLTDLILKHECQKTLHKSPVAETKKLLKYGLQFACNECPKIFTSYKNLYQHLISHETERKHKCGLCARAFKRRGGLTQHMKGFHLQLKPYECETCKHRYALKGDMLRCRHSLLQKRNNTEGANVAPDTAADTHKG